MVVASDFNVHIYLLVPRCYGLASAVLGVVRPHHSHDGLHCIHLDTCGTTVTGMTFHRDTTISLYLSFLP